MNTFEVYKTYVALKTHFSSKAYDFFKFNGTVKNVSYASLEKRKDKKLFEYLAYKVENKEIIPFMVANFIVSENFWIGELVDDFVSEYNGNYRAWKNKFQRLSYIFQEDLNNISNFLLDKNISYDKLIEYEDGKHPILFRFLLQGMIELETFVILNRITPFVEYFNSKMEDDLVWEPWYQKSKAYEPFIVVNMEKFKKIFNDTI